MAESRTTMFLKIATKNNLLTPAQAEQILSAVEQRRDLGVERSPGELAVEKGFLTPPQVDVIESTLRSLLPPEQIGGFRILEQIGRGAVGTVYRARQLSLDKIVALKVLHAGLVNHQRFVEQFIQEARAAARLSHPHVVQPLDAGASDGYNFLVMELVEGETLRQLLKRIPQLPETRGVEIARAVGQALEHAHSRGILHRDVKPDNILLDKSGVAKIADFGLAIPIDDVDLLAEEHRRMGTPYYLSPEQAQGKEIDERSDLYSLGATLYHATVGRPLFTGTTVKEILTKQVHQAPVAVREAGVRISEAFEHIIMKLVEKDPAARYQSAKALLEALSRLPESGMAPVAPAPGSLSLGEPQGAARGAAALPPPKRGGTSSAVSVGPARKATRSHPGATRAAPVDEPPVPQPQKLLGKRVFTIAGAAVGSLIAVIFIIVAVSRAGERAGAPTEDAKLKNELEDLAKEDIKARRAAWKKRTITDPSESVDKVIKAMGTTSVENVKHQINSLWDGLKRDADSPNAFALLERIQNLRQNTRQKDVSHADEVLFNPVEELVKQGRYAQAMELLDKTYDWPKELKRDDAVRARAKARSNELADEVQRLWVDAKAGALKLREGKKYDEAIAVLDGLGAWASVETLHEAEQIRQAIVEERDQFVAMERERREKDELGRYKAFAAGLAPMCVAREFAAFRTQAEELKAGVQSESVQKLLAEDFAALECMEGFLADFMGALEKSKTTGKAITFKLLSKDKYTGKVDKVEGDKVWVRVTAGSGSASVPIDYVKITDANFFEIVSDHVGGKNEHYLVPVAVLAVYREQYDVCDALLEQAKQQGHNVERWVKQLEWRKANVGGGGGGG